MSRHSKRRAEARAVGTLKAYHEGAHARCSQIAQLRHTLQHRRLPTPGLPSTFSPLSML